MKRYAKVLVLLVVLASILAVFCVSASATDLKIGIGVVKANGGLRLRSGPGTGYDILATAANGDNVVIISESDGWYYVDYNLKRGYMSKDYVIFKERENVMLGTGKVNTGAYFRTGPSTSNSAITLLNYGTEVEIIGLNCTWYKVTCKGYTGYIRSDLVDLTEAPLYNSNRGSSSGCSTSAGEKVVAYAKTLLGIPYVWGGTSKSGFDCSGYVQYVYKQCGVSINRTADAQMSNGYKVSSDQLMPGDLVFFAGTYNTSGASHVGIYIGGGQFIHASSGTGNVTISNLWSDYYKAHYYGARRIVS